MNLRIKRCLFGLLTWAALVGGANAQPPQPEGSVQLGPAPTEQLPPQMSPLDESTGQANVSNYFGYTSVDRVFRARVNIDSRGGGLYGYNPGFTNVGVFMPFGLDDEDALVFVDARGLMTHEGGGGANVGFGWRAWNEDLDRITGLSAWYDYDSGNGAKYNQIGLSFESLGRYVDYRLNGYVPVGETDTQLVSTVDPAAAFFLQNRLVFARTNVFEQTYTGFDAEVGGPLPYLGRYGVNGYVGGYHFMGNGRQGGSFTGVSGRFLAQINEDWSFGLQMTDDHEFGLNTQFQVFVTLPDGMPSRWLRNPRVKDRLTASVFRQYRVMSKAEQFTTFDAVAINPKDGEPYFVAHIDPNAGPVGNGFFESPFNSIAEYNALPEAQRRGYDIIYVRARLDGTNTNLDTTPTFTVFDNQRLLSRAVAHTFQSTNFPGVDHVLPGFEGGLLPQIFNSSGADVITLADGAQCMEVSGFDITGSAGGNGISGTNNGFININRNDIHDGFNGINLVNLIDSTHGPSVIDSNILRDNVNDGFHLLNIGGPSVTDLQITNNTAFGNGDDGFDIAADAGSIIGGLIDGNSTVPDVGSLPNGDAGLSLATNAGLLVFNTPGERQISNNNFSSNNVDGVFIDVTNDGVANLLFIGNTLNGNGGAGINVAASDSSLINLVVGGPDDTLDRNTITGNGNAGILLDLSNTANGVTATIENNLISGNEDGIRISVADSASFGPGTILDPDGSEIFDNEITDNRRDGIRLTRSDDATLDLGTPAEPPIHDNTITGNLGNGLSLIVTDTAVPPVNLATEDNLFNGNGGDGLNIDVSDSGVVNYDSNRDSFSSNTGNGLNLITNDQANLVANLVNVSADGNGQNGMRSFANNLLNVPISGQVINVISPIDPDFAGQSSFTGNGANGILTIAAQQAFVTINLDTVTADSNGADGWHLDRFDASLILATATNSTFSSNGNDGIEFFYSGSPPTDPNQPFFGPLGFSQLNLNLITADANGGNGLNTLGTADAALVANVVFASFSNNTLNGVLITTELGSQFGNRPAPGSPRSVFDAVTITGNGQDGIHVDQNGFLATRSDVYMEVNTNSGNTDISTNGDDGVHVESDGSETDILLIGTNGNLFTINNNVVNGVRWDVTSGGGPAGHLMTIDNVTINGNGGDGIQFNTPTGFGTMVVLNSLITNSGDDGINVNVTALDDPTTLSLGGFAFLNAVNNLIDGNFAHGVNVQLQGDDTEIGFSPNVQVFLTGNNQITNNGLNGVNVELRGLSESRFFPNAFVIDGNRIALNGQRNVFNQSHGIFFLQDAGPILRVGSNGSLNSHRRIEIQTPRPTNPDGPFDPFIPLFGPGIPDYNTGDNANVAFFLSRYMNLATNLNSTLEVTNNIIEFNGAQPTAPGEGVFLRLSTNSYLSADISGNTFTGNGSSDFRSESFITGGNPPPSTAAAAPTPDVVFLDDTAQLDLRLANNTGQSIQPRYVFGNPNLGAQYMNPDFYKTNNFIPRGVQLFAVDDSPTGLDTNTFTNLLAPQQTLFFNAGYHLNQTPFVLNNLAFPEDFNTDPGDPFLP